MRLPRLLTLLLPTAASIYVRYNETEAKNFLNLAAAAYPVPSNTTSRNACLQKTYPNDNYTVLMALTASCDKNQNECQAFAAVSIVTKTIILSFRGTEGMDQLVQELKYGLQDYMGFNETDKFGNYSICGRVNKYFYKAMDTFWQAMVQPIVTKYPGFQYQVTGHSLGGALAALTAFRIAYRGVINSKYDLKLITFGEPREGDYDYATIFQQYVPYAFRIVHYTDPVPHLPPLHEDNITAPAYPFHHTKEIWLELLFFLDKEWYRYDKKFEVATQCSDTWGEDETCSDQKRFWNYGTGAMNEHLVYFKHYISEYGWNGCVDSADKLSIFSLLAVFFYVYFA